MEIERLFWNSQEAFSKIRAGIPVVLLQCPLIYPHYVNWTPDNIANMLADDFRCDVQVSNDKRFLYGDDSKNTYGYNYTHTAHKAEMTFRDFMILMRESESSNNNEQFYYLQNGLYAEMGPRILEEYQKLSLETAATYKIVGKWQELTRNLLLYGGSGYITPLHFDEQENIFCQLYGRKRARLLSPEYWFTVYPFPNGHPCDRQCQVTLSAQPGVHEAEDREQYSKFPAFAEMATHEYFVDLEPGEVLYIPQYWFHQLEGLTENISLSWWFKNTKKGENVDISNINLDPVTIITLRRNIESLLARMVGSGANAREYFLALASGAIKIPGLDYSRSHASTASTSSPEPTGQSNTGNSVLNNVTNHPSYVQLDLLALDVETGATKLQNIQHRRELWDAVTARALEMLSLIVRPEHAPGFLLQVVSGRFNFL
eukprot:gene28003-33816_t